MQKRLMFSLMALVVVGCDGGMAVPSDGSTGCSGITGNYTANGTIQTGSTCDASLSTLSATVSVGGDASGYNTVLSVGGIDYTCNGIVNGCRWDATCTGTGTDGSMVRGMLSVTFTNTGFSGTMSEDFSGTTACHNMFAVIGTRS